MNIKNAGELLVNLPTELALLVLEKLAFDDILNLSIAFPHNKVARILGDGSGASAKILADSLRKMPSADRAKRLSLFTSIHGVTAHELRLILGTLQAVYNENPHEERPPYLFTLLQSERQQVLHSLLLSPHGGARLLDEVLENCDIKQRPYGLSPCTVLKEAASSPFVNKEQLDIILTQLRPLVTRASLSQLPFDVVDSNEQAEILNEYKGVLKAVMRSGAVTTDQIKTILDYGDEELLWDAIGYSRTPIDALFARYDVDHWPYSHTRKEFLTNIARRSNIAEELAYQILERSYDFDPSDRGEVLAVVASRSNVSAPLLDVIIEQLDRLDPTYWKNTLKAILLSSEATERQRDIAWRYVSRIPVADRVRIFRAIGPYVPSEWIDSILDHMGYVRPSRETYLLFVVTVNKRATARQLMSCLEWLHNISPSSHGYRFSAILDHENAPLDDIWARIVTEYAPYGLSRKTALVSMAGCERITSERLDAILQQLDTLPPADWKDILIAVCSSPQSTIRHHQKALERLHCFEKSARREILSAMAWRCELTVVDEILDTYLWYCNIKDRAPVLRSLAQRTDITIGQLSTVLDRIKEIPSWEEDKTEALAAVAGNSLTTEPMLHDILSFIESRPPAENVFRNRFIANVLEAIAKSSVVSEPLLNGILSHINDLPTGWPRARVLRAIAKSPGLTEQLVEPIITALDALDAADDRRGVLRELANSNFADKKLNNDKTLVDNILDRYTDFLPDRNTSAYPTVHETYADIASSGKILERQQYSILARLHQIDSSGFRNSWGNVLSSVAFRANQVNDVTANTPRMLDMVLQYLNGVSPWKWETVPVYVARNPYVLSRHLDRVLALLDDIRSDSWRDILTSITESSSATAEHFVAVIERVDKMPVAGHVINKAYIRTERQAVLTVVLNRVGSLSNPVDRKNVLLALGKSAHISANQIDTFLERVGDLPSAEDRRDLLIVIARNRNAGEKQLGAIIDRLDDKEFNMDDKCAIMAAVAENSHLGGSQWERVLERIDIFDDASLRIILHAAARSATIREAQLGKVLEQVDEGNLPNSGDRRELLVAAALNRNMTAPLFDILLKRVNELMPEDQPAVLIAAAGNEHVAHRQLVQYFEYVDRFTLPEDRGALLAAIGANPNASTPLLQRVIDSAIGQLDPVYRRAVFVAVAGNKNASTQQIIGLLKHMPHLSPAGQGALLLAAARGFEPLAELLIPKVILQIRALPNAKDQRQVVDALLERIHELPDSGSKRMVLCAVAVLSPVITEANLFKVIRHIDDLQEPKDRESVLNAVLKRIAIFPENPAGVLVAAALNSVCRKEQFIKILDRLDKAGEHNLSEEQSKQVLNAVTRSGEAPLDIMLQRIQAAFDNHDENQAPDTTKPYGLPPEAALAHLCRSKHLTVEQLDTVLALMNGLNNESRGAVCKELADNPNLTAEQSIVFLQHLENSNLTWDEKEKLFEKNVNTPNAPIDALLERASTGNWHYGIWPTHIFATVFRSKQLTKAQIGNGLGAINVLSARVGANSEELSDREKAIQGLFDHIGAMRGPQERRDTIAFVVETRAGDYFCLFQIVAKHFNAYAQPAPDERRNLRDILLQGLNALIHPTGKDNIFSWMIWQINHLTDPQEQREHLVAIANSPIVSPKALVKMIRSADEMPDAECAKAVLDVVLLRADGLSNNAEQQANILKSVIDCRHAAKPQFIKAIECASNTWAAGNANVFNIIISAVLNQLDKLPTTADKAEVLIEAVRNKNISDDGFAVIFNSAHVTSAMLSNIIEQAGSLNPTQQAKVLHTVINNPQITNAHLDAVLARLTPQNIFAGDRAVLLAAIARHSAVNAAQIKRIDAGARSLQDVLAQRVFTAVTEFHIRARHNHVYGDEPMRIEYRVDDGWQAPASTLGFCKGIWESKLGVKQFATHHKDNEDHVYTIGVKRQAIAAKIWGKWEADIKKHDNYVNLESPRLPKVRGGTSSIAVPADGDHLEVSRMRRIARVFTRS